MGDIISAISHDMDDYERRCRKYNEKVRTKRDAYGNYFPDCYGKHAKKLEERERTE